MVPTRMSASVVAPVGSDFQDEIEMLRADDAKVVEYLVMRIEAVDSDRRPVESSFAGVVVDGRYGSLVAVIEH